MNRDQVFDASGNDPSTGSELRAAHVGGAWVSSSVLDFDLSQIPEGAVIRSARLTLRQPSTPTGPLGHVDPWVPGEGGSAAYFGEGGSVPSGLGSGILAHTPVLSFYSVTTDWTPSDASPPAAGTVNASFINFTSSNGTDQFGITSVVQDLVDHPQARYGILMKWQEQAEGAVTYASSEAGVRKPTLQITYQLPREETYYIRDASGNVVSIYSRTFDQQGVASAEEPEQVEVPIYAAGRVGTYRPQEAGYGLQAAIYYELNDHLGNVRAVIRGVRDPNGTQAEIVDWADYYPARATESLHVASRACPPSSATATPTRASRPTRRRVGISLRCGRMTRG